MSNANSSIGRRNEANRELKKHKEHLEELVGKRTAELSSTNELLSEALDQVRESEEKYRSLVENINIGIYRATPGSRGRYMEVNPAMVKIFGYENRDELLAMNISDAYQNPGDRKKYSDKLSAQGYVVNEELYLKRKDGTPVILSDTGIAIYNDNGDIEYFDGIVEDVTERKKAEEKLLAYQEELRSLASELSLAEERERRRIASELHDHLGQTLALSKIKLGSLKKIFRTSKIAKDIEDVYELIEEAIRNTRSLTFELSPPVLYELGLEAALGSLADRFKKEFNVNCSLKKSNTSPPSEGGGLSGTLLSLKSDINAIIFRAVRELLINVVKHASAKNVSISMQNAADFIRISVEDDGIGFQENNIIPSGEERSGFGLFSIRERFRHMGGNMKIESQPDNGARVVLILPKSAEDLRPEHNGAQLRP